MTIRVSEHLHGEVLRLQLALHRGLERLAAALVARLWVVRPARRCFSSGRQRAAQEACAQPQQAVRGPVSHVPLLERGHGDCVEDVRFCRDRFLIPKATWFGIFDKTNPQLCVSILTYI